MAHLEVTAGSGRVLAGTVGAADLLDLLAQALQSGVHLQVTVTENVGVISTEHAEGIGSLLLGLGNEAKVESTARGTRCSRRSGRSRRTLGDEKGRIGKRRSWLNHYWYRLCGAPKGAHEVNR